MFWYLSIRIDLSKLERWLSWWQQHISFQKDWVIAGKLTSCPITELLSSISNIRVSVLQSQQKTKLGEKSSFLRWYFFLPKSQEQRSTAGVRERTEFLSGVERKFSIELWGLLYPAFLFSLLDQNLEILKFSVECRRREYSILEGHCTAWLVC